MGQADIEIGKTVRVVLRPVDQEEIFGQRAPYSVAVKIDELGARLLVRITPKTQHALRRGLPIAVHFRTTLQ